MDLKEPVNHFIEYVETRLELFRLQLLDKFSSVFSTVVSILILVSLFILFVIFISITAGLFLGQLLGHYYIGFAIVTGFYLLLTLVFFIFKRQLIYNPILNKMVTIFFPEKNEANNGTEADQDV